MVSQLNGKDSFSKVAIIAHKRLTDLNNSFGTSSIIITELDRPLKNSLMQNLMQNPFKKLTDITPLLFWYGLSPTN